MRRAFPLLLAACAHAAPPASPGWRTIEQRGSGGLAGYSLRVPAGVRGGPVTTGDPGLAIYGGDGVLIEATLSEYAEDLCPIDLAQPPREQALGGRPARLATLDARDQPYVTLAAHLSDRLRGGLSVLVTVAPGDEARATRILEGVVWHEPTAAPLRPCATVIVSRIEDAELPRAACKPDEGAIGLQTTDPRGGAYLNGMFNVEGVYRSYGELVCTTPGLHAVWLRGPRGGKRDLLMPVRAGRQTLIHAVVSCAGSDECAGAEAAR